MRLSEQGQESRGSGKRQRPMRGRAKFHRHPWALPLEQPPALIPPFLTVALFP